MYNVVYINTHDTGRVIEPYGYQVPTKALSEFAKDAATFTHAYCVSPTCSPSRASMLTGVYPHQNGMLGLAQRGFSLKQKERHLANYLKEHGYQTAISGIQHEVGWYLDLEPDLIHEIGYDDILTTPSSFYKKEDLHLWDENNASMAINWLKTRDKSKPFLLSFGLHSTHRPYPIEIDSSIDMRYVKPIAPIANTVENRNDHAQYLTSALHADQQIERILQALKDIGEYSNTIILFTTDHGLALPFHKCGLKDTGIGVSLILRHPKYGKGEVKDSLVSQIDVFPTLCDCLNLPKPEYLEGVSFFNSLTSNQETRDEVFAEVNFHTSYEPIRCIRTKRYKYIQYFDEEWLKINCSNIDESIPKDYYMNLDLIHKVKPKEALYDCLYDPSEINNLIDNNDLIDVVSELRNKLNDFMRKTDDPLCNGPLEIKSTYKVNKKSCVVASSKEKEDYDERGVQ